MVLSYCSFSYLERQHGTQRRRHDRRPRMRNFFADALAIDLRRFGTNLPRRRGMSRNKAERHWKRFHIEQVGLIDEKSARPRRISQVSNRIEGFESLAASNPTLIARRAASPS